MLVTTRYLNFNTMSTTKGMRSMFIVRCVIALIEATIANSSYRKWSCDNSFLWTFLTSVIMNIPVFTSAVNSVKVPLLCTSCNASSIFLLVLDTKIESKMPHTWFNFLSWCWCYWVQNAFRFWRWSWRLLLLSFIKSDPWESLEHWKWKYFIKHYIILMYQLMTITNIK